MPTFNITVYEQHAWDLEIDAQDEWEALEIASQTPLTGEPDTIDTVDVVCHGVQDAPV